MKTLSQKRYFDKREMKISNSRLFYHDQRIGNRNIDFDIPFEEISNLKISHRHFEFIFLAISVFAFFMSYFCFITRNDKDAPPNLWIIFGLGGVFTLIYFLFKSENSWKIKLRSGAAIYVHKNIPNKETVDQFVDYLFTTKNQYLRNTYLNLDKNLSYENQYSNLKWLMSSEIITHEEFEAKYSELKELYNFDKKSIGFGY